MINSYQTQEDDPGPYDVNPDHEAEDAQRELEDGELGEPEHQWICDEPVLVLAGQ